MNTHPFSRRWFIGAALLCPMMLSACDRSANPSTQSNAVVVLYTSVDDTFAHMVADAFTEETGIRVEILGDTEATKTTGLVTRIQAEMDHPQADVWWSSEPMGTILLDQSGALEPQAMHGMIPEDWPTPLRAQNWSWIGIAMRARVIAYATDRIEHPPTTLAQLTDPAYKGRVGMARPQFGTTRIHMAMLADQWGTENLSAWLNAMKHNSIRLYDGNARVVQAIALGEIDIGLTDTDDVWAGQDNGWKVDLNYETHSDDENNPSLGPTLIPNTVAIIHNAPHPQLALQLAEFLVSERVEEMLYHSPSHNTPVHPALRARLTNSLEHGVLEIDAIPDYLGASTKVREAMEACEQVLINP
ncbi:MAG: extracellular solute-binding protein [Phycisphaerales bacterium]